MVKKKTAVTNTIPDGSVAYAVTDHLPEVGEENTIYIIEASDDPELISDWIYINGSWEKAYVSKLQYNIYTNELINKVAELEERIAELEGGRKVLFSGSDITLTEKGATRGEYFNVSTDIAVSEGTKFYVTLKDMTVNGKPIDDVTGEITAYAVSTWDWQGGELYTDAFGNGAYFAFGTEPKDGIAKKVSLGFVNEAGDFDSRTLVIGNVKVEVD